MDVRRKEAEGFINTGKCQDTKQRLVYTTTIVLFRLNLLTNLLKME
jgi:hypothetical protein